jgi:cytochrome b pre-mRNA-processing protein 3
MTFWSKFLKKTARNSPVRAVYEAIVAAARHPQLYAEFGVPDTVAGRFDMIALHAFLVLERTKDTQPEFAQALTDEVFRDMDRSLREMGVGDLSVGKKVRKLAEMFYGRIAAYRESIEQPDELVRALSRNVWPEASANARPGELANHARTLRGHLAAQLPARIAAGQIDLT